MLNRFLNILVVISLTLASSCSEDPNTYVKHINGYWEIKDVKLSNGSIKQYTYNETIDYIQVNDSLKGFRKKLKPSINNTYFQTNDAENITLKIEGNQLYIYYKTPYLSWKEQVKEASETTLKLINTNKDTYIYQRYTPIELSVE